MKKVGFIGVYDKTDFILCVAKILTEMGQRVLVVDATRTQKARYVVPMIKPTSIYVTEFEGFDVAGGFENYEKLMNYFSINNEEESGYDIVLIDTSSIKALNNFRLLEADKKYFVTSFDLYSLKRGLEIIGSIEKAVDFTKILFSKEMSEEENEYLDFLSSSYKIIWNAERIYFPFEIGDQSVMIENQRVAKIKFRKLSSEYKEGLLNVANEIMDRS